MVGVAPNAVLTNQAACQLPAKTLVRFKIEARVVDYYLKTGRPLLAQNMLWDRLCNFQIEMEMIDEKKKDNSSLELPLSAKV